MKCDWHTGSVRPPGRAQLVVLLLWDNRIHCDASCETPGTREKTTTGIPQLLVQTGAGMRQGCQCSSVFHNQALAGRRGDCWEFLVFPCEVLWACLLVKHRSSVVNCLRPSGFHRTTPAYSKWKLRWVSMLFTKGKENWKQQLAKWQTVKKWLSWGCLSVNIFIHLFLWLMACLLNYTSSVVL